MGECEGSSPLSPHSHEVPAPARGILYPVPIMPFAVKVRLTPDCRLSASLYPKPCPSSVRGGVFASQDESHDSATETGVSGTLLVNTQKLETVHGDTKAPGFKVGWGALSETSRFTRAGGRAIACAASALERVAPVSEILFITLTVPGSALGVFEAVARYSARLVHGFKAWVNKRVPSKLDFYVWEYQKRGALHLHYAVHVPNPADRQYIWQHTRAQWCRQLIRLGDEIGVDFFARSNGETWRNRLEVVRARAEEVRKSLSRYLSKYLSKSVKDSTQIAGGIFRPSRFYGISRPLHQLINEQTTEKEFDLGDGFRYAINVFEDVAAWVSRQVSCAPSTFVPFPYSRVLIGSVQSDDFDLLTKNLMDTKSPKDLESSRDWSSGELTVLEKARRLHTEALIRARSHFYGELVDKSPMISALTEPTKRALLSSLPPASYSDFDAFAQALDLVWLIEKELPRKRVDHLTWAVLNSAKGAANRLAEVLKDSSFL